VDEQKMRAMMPVGERAAQSGHSRANRSVTFARSRVGRVVEIRVWGVPNLVEIQALRASVDAAVYRAGDGAVICADYRRASPLSRAVANALARAMRTSIQAIARSAALLEPANAMFNLQVERVVRCAGSPVHRLFADPEELTRWLDGDLRPPEREALRAFLSEDSE